MFGAIHHGLSIPEFEKSPVMKNPDIITQMMRHRKVVRQHEQG